MGLVRNALSDQPRTLLEVTEAVGRSYQVYNLRSAVHVVLYRLVAKAEAKKTGNAWTLTR